MSVHVWVGVHVCMPVCVHLTYVCLCIHVCVRACVCVPAVTCVGLGGQHCEVSFHSTFKRLQEFRLPAVCRKHLPAQLYHWPWRLLGKKVPSEVFPKLLTTSINSFLWHSLNIYSLEFMPVSFLAQQKIMNLKSQVRNIPFHPRSSRGSTVVHHGLGKNGRKEDPAPLPIIWQLWPLGPNVDCLAFTGLFPFLWAWQSFNRHLLQQIYFLDHRKDSEHPREKGPRHRGETSSYHLILVANLCRENNSEAKPLRKEEREAHAWISFE